jgi:hypothetical protein
VGREEGSYCRAVSQMQERWEVEYTLPVGRRRAASATVEALRVARPRDSFTT